MKKFGKFFAVVVVAAFFGIGAAMAGEGMACCPMGKGAEMKKCEKGQCKTNFGPKNRKASPEGMSAK